MDAVATGAITAIPLDDRLVERWFEVLADTYDNNDSAEWHTLAQALRDNARNAGVPDQSVELFLQYLGANSTAPAEVLSTLSAARDELPAYYRQALAQMWAAFLVENATQWDGSENSWPQFRDWFAQEADTRGLGESATGFLGYVESQPDKVAAFAQYGVAIQAASSTSAYPELKAGDEGDWVNYLDQMLRSRGY